MRLDERAQAVLSRPAVVGLVVAAAAAWLLWPVPLGHPPLTKDHTVHLFRAWHFFTKLLAEGSVAGWSDYWFAGWPAGEDYPPGADLWLAGMRLLTFPFSWETTYALGFFAMYAVSGLALWRTARSFGPIAALLGALLFVLDRGAYREGGFVYGVEWGVWPQQLSTAALFLGITWLDEALAEGGVRRYGLAAVAMGGSLLCHPLSLVSLAIALPVLIITHRALGGVSAVRSLGRGFGVVLLGVLLAAYFLVPFSANKESMAAYGDPYRSLPSIALGLVRGDLFGNVPAPLVWLGLLGFGLGVWRRQRTAVLLGLFMLLTLIAASSTVLAVTEHISSSFGRIQYQRLATPAKACLFLLAAWTLAPAWGPSWSRRVGWASLILVPVLVGMRHPDRRVNTGGSPTRQPDYARFLDWSRAEKESSKGFYRIAYVSSYNDHFFAAAPVYNDTAAYKVGFTPASVFVHKPDQASEELYRVLGVKWVVSRRPETTPGLRLARHFGRIRLYRFEGYDPERFTMRGVGRARAERFDSERIRLAFEGTNAYSRVVLHVARHPSWRARLDGRTVPIRTAILASEPIFMEIPANGRRLEVDFEAGAVHIVARSLSVAAILFSAFLLLAPARAQALRSRLTWFEPALVGSVALMLVIGAAAKIIGRPSPPLWRALDHVASAEAMLGDHPCQRSRDRLNCSPKGWNYVGPTKVRIGGVLKECIWAHPRDGLPLRVRFAGVPSGKTLLVSHGLADQAVDAARDGAPVRIDVAVDGRPLGGGVQPNRKRWNSFSLPLSNRPSAGDLEVTIQTDREGARHFCFDAEVR